MSYACNKRWRKRFPEKRKEERNRYYNKTSTGNSKSFQRWSQKDDIIVMTSSLTDPQIHSKIGRSVRAIQVRRCKIKYGLCETGGL